MKRFVSGKGFVELRVSWLDPGMSLLETDAQEKIGGFCVRERGEPRETGEGL